MSARDIWKLLAFRDGQRVVSGRQLLRELLFQIRKTQDLHQSTSAFAQEELLEGLLRAGELECGLADCGINPTLTAALAAITDEFAGSLIAEHPTAIDPALLRDLDRVSAPEQLELSPPEGFCYYALHPLDYADLLNELAPSPPAAAVVGIRSIGTTLSAVVSAWFQCKGIRSERITVRPSGDPFDRRLVLSLAERDWMTRQAQAQAQFFIVDEGPGLSGSSFLSVAEAIEAMGVPAASIVLLPSSTPNLEALIAPNAAQRWRRYRIAALRASRRIPDGAIHDVGGGEWRKRAFAGESEWPAVWPWTERRKYLSGDEQRLFRFDGLAHYGRAVRQRSEILAHNHWGPAISHSGNGFSETRWLSGRVTPQVDGNLLIRLARYCAFRVKAFSYEAGPQAALEGMAQVNLERTLGSSPKILLPIERPMIADARMMPHEWILCSDGELWKVDAASHGDDHFYPGPTDIAWDLAGAIVEWQLGAEETELFISEYELQARDRIKSRLGAYILAYSAFRLGVVLSASASLNDLLEKARFDRLSSIYRTRAATLLNHGAAA